MSKSINTLIAEIDEQMKKISVLSDQTAVHRKKFEFALSQFRTLKTKLLSDQNNAKNESILDGFLGALNELHTMLTQNLLQTWTQPTIENSCNYVVDKLKEIFGRLKQLLPDSQYMEFDEEMLKNYNVLDLQAIQASFTQYLGLKDIDMELAKKIEKRICSIEETLSKSDSKNEFVHRTFSPIPVNYQSWCVDIDDFDKIKQIGSGVSANVYYGKCKKNDIEVAIKEFKFQRLNGSKLQSFQREVAVLATLQHPALLKLIGATDKIPFCIILEWMPNKSLYHDLHINHHLNQTGKSIAAYDIARGMKFLHSNQIVHRDLKSLNILLDKNNRIRICDFGFSRHASEDSLMSQNIGTPHWMAPEILSTSTNYTSKVDVYAFGVVLWELATSQVPYSGLEASQIIAQVLANDIRPEIPSDLNPGMKKLITQCWDRNPDNRPTFHEIVERIQSGECVFNGTNLNEFKKYIQKNATINEILFDELKKNIEDIQTTKSISPIVSLLNKSKPPTNILKYVWNEIIEKTDIKQYKNDEITEFLSLFIKTSKIGETAKIICEMPKDSISLPIITKFVMELPTGSEETDTNIVIAACKNHCADLCCLYAVKPEDIGLSLEIIIHEGFDPQLKTAIIDLCVQFLGKSNVILSSSALRFLLSFGEIKHIQMNSLKSFIHSTDESLKLCSLVALSNMAIQEIYPSKEIIEELITNWNSNQLISNVIIPSCKNRQIAEFVLNNFETQNLIPNLSFLKSLIVISQLKDLIPRIQNIIKAKNLINVLPKYSKELNMLLCQSI